MDDEKPKREQEWANEIARRVQELRDGAVETIPWTEVRRRAVERINDQRH